MCSDPTSTKNVPAPSQPEGEQPAVLRRWRIYLADRELARVNDDPCFGTVVAASKEEAEAHADAEGLLTAGCRFYGCSPWAVEVRS